MPTCAAPGGCRLLLTRWPSSLPTHPSRLAFLLPALYAAAQDVTSQLLWWVLLTCDPALSTPGPEEAAGIGSKKWWPRDRNVRLPWPALEASLAQALAAGGSRQRYLKDWWESKRNRLYFDSAGVVAQGGAGCPAS